MYCAQPVLISPSFCWCAAVGVEGQRGRILARKLDEVLAAGDALLRGAGKVGGRILDADDPGQLRQFAHRGGQHVDHRPGRDVVDDDRQVRRIVDRGKMRDQPGLRRPVVIGRHHQRGIGAHGFGVADQADPLGGRVRARPGDHRNASGGGLDHRLDHRAMFIMGQRRAFARGANRHKAVAALLDMPVHQFLERVKVHRAVLERRDQSREGSLEHDTLLLGVGGDSPVKTRPD